MLEKERGDFASLIERPEQEIDQAEWYQYIDTFIVTMGGEAYFDAVHFLQYGQSKQKFLSIPKRWDKFSDETEGGAILSIGACKRKYKGQG
ncbi:hypothetical protein [Methylomusa anaerophila]|uniref:Uncharacterized protein n=1 Tax=Methylomusa anaerophila TaxID=1930071 RepID=A0A348AQY1_9FIRM|nr:hypothetical protein [Methylomusa anaerophila]BBB93479.1 hypothetical protein MAMMFC1_04196 [Methylomusa anaerophila]